MNISVSRTTTATILSRLETLAQLSESDDGLTRQYLSVEHREANELVGGWMREAGMRPNVITYTSAIRACRDAGRLDDSLALFSEAIPSL